MRTFFFVDIIENHVGGVYYNGYYTFFFLMFFKD